YAPRRASSRACDRPRPPPAPVMIATLPSKERSAMAPGYGPPVGPSESPGTRAGRAGRVGRGHERRRPTDPLRVVPRAERRGPPARDRPAGGAPGPRRRRDPGPPLPAPLRRHVVVDGHGGGHHDDPPGVPRRGQPPAAAARRHGKGGRHHR